MADAPPPRNADEARERAREAVRKAYDQGLVAPERTCRSCGTTSATFSGKCPACDKRYDRRLPWLGDTARRGLIAAALLALLGIVVAVAPNISESKTERAERLEQEERTRIRAEQARLVREQRVVRAEAAPTDDPKAPVEERLALRAGMVDDLEAAIFTETGKRFASGELKGSRVKEVRCSALVANKGKKRDDELLERPLGRYDCVAVQREVVRSGKVLGYLGHPFVGAVRFGTGELTFCKDNKAPSERGESLAEVVVPPECIGAEGADRLGNGYVDPYTVDPAVTATPET